MHRQGKRVSGRIGDIRVQAGDFLVLLVGREFDLLDKDLGENFEGVLPAGAVSTKEFMVAMEVGTDRSNLVKNSVACGKLLR